MMLKEGHIKDKKVVGHMSDDRPIVMVETYGGLFAFFTKSKDGSVETLAAAPHRAIGAFMCEQKDPDIKWNKRIDEISKTEASELFTSLRDRMLSPDLSLVKSDEQYYLYYDHNEGTFELVHGADLQDMARSGEIDVFGLIRKADFSEPIMIVKDKL